MLGTAFLAFDEGIDATIQRIPVLKRPRLRRVLERHRRQFLRDAFAEFRNRGSQPEQAPALGDEDGTDNPILDFWRWLIESGKLQPFLSFLVTDFLPKLFELIIQIIEAISAVSSLKPTQ